MIAMLPDAIGNHVFKVSVTDLAGQTTVQDLTFHYGQVTLETADLWQNTATLKIVPSATAASATLEYKRSTDRRLAAGDRFRQRQRHFHGRDRADLEFIDQRNG